MRETQMSKSSPFSKVGFSTKDFSKEKKKVKY